MSYNYHTEITSRNHSGPRGVAITGITWHHWGDDGLFNDSQDDNEARGIASYLSRSGGNTSAHIVISGRDVYQIVPDGMYAWHAGSSEGNRKTIGIEVDPDAEKQADTYQTCAEVARDLEKHHGRLIFYRHNDWKNTACPGDLDTGRIRRMADSTAPTTATPTKESGFMSDLTKAQQEEVHRATTAKVRDGDRWLEPHDAERVQIILARRNSAELKALSAAVGVLAKSVGVDPKAVIAAVEKAVRDALPDDITISLEG